MLHGCASSSTLRRMERHNKTAAKRGARNDTANASVASLVAKSSRAASRKRSGFMSTRPSRPTIQYVQSDRDEQRRKAASSSSIQNIPSTNSSSTIAIESGSRQMRYGRAFFQMFFAGQNIVALSYWVLLKQTRFIHSLIHNQAPTKLLNHLRPMNLNQSDL